MKNVSDKKTRNVKFSIGLKLIFIISVLVIVSLGTVTFLVSYFMSADLQVTTEENNFSTTMKAATTVENELSSIRSSVFLMLDMLNAAGSSGVLMRQTSAYFFERNQNIAAVVIPGNRNLVNNRFFVSNEIEASLVDDFISSHADEVSRSESGEAFVLNAAPSFGIPVLVMMYPWREGGLNETAIIFFTSNLLSDTFGTGSASVSFMINHEGDLLVHSDIELTKAGASMAKSPLVQIMRANNDENRQVLFTGEDGKEYFGSYCKIATADIGVLTTIERATALKSVTNQTKLNIYLALAVLFIAIMGVFFYSKTLSKPLSLLTDVADEINQGNFETTLFDKLQTKRRDEIGVLFESTKNEQNILNTVSKLTNKGVAKAIVRKEINFEPHLKDVTIFFSDIRGFTAISDGFNNRFGKDSPREIIGFLNDYMSRMVNCITLTGGNVDKFEGDAVMAVWGVLREDSLEYEEMADSNPLKKELKSKHEAHVKSDAINAIRGTIAMRYALMEYNKEAEAFTKAHEKEPLAKYKPHIRIGCGLNSGRATVGFMGSYDKMEFTSIGDAVNLASRTESSNKPCGTDVLITEDTYNLLKYDFIKSEFNNFTIKEENKKDEIIVEVIPVTFEVKGKGKQHFYGVVNMPQFDIEAFFKAGDPNFVVDKDCAKSVGPNGPKTLAEVRKLLGIPTPDFGGVNLDAEENKVTAS
ncbi:MAG: adenylate/guanylate cyclase domain-containing protein [Spirochaetaceae bacterium]|nr:adenylate/guanylate cyclase domain-containing protein [Spirochaetaceae bacterium]